MHFRFKTAHEGIIAGGQDENERVFTAFGEVRRRHIADVANPLDRLLDTVAGHLANTCALVQDPVYGRKADPRRSGNIVNSRAHVSSARTFTGNFEVRKSENYSGILKAVWHAVERWARRLPDDFPEGRAAIASPGSCESHIHMAICDMEERKAAFGSAFGLGLGPETGTHGHRRGRERALGEREKCVAVHADCPEESP
jgi:hypothetical protein